MCYTSPSMKRLPGWQLVLFAMIFLVGVLWSGRWWHAWASPAIQNGTATDFASDVTPTVTPTPLVPQSADTGGIVWLASVLLLIILGGMALGWRLTNTSRPVEPDKKETSSASSGRDGKTVPRKGCSG